MASNHYTDMGLEVKKKLFKRSILKILLEYLPDPLDYDLIDIYLESPDFPLKPLGNLSVQKTPLALPQNSFYIGEIEDGKPHGLGYLINDSRSYYEGFFMKGKFSGKGRLFTSSGQVIIGEWVESELSQGKILNFNNKTYEGELKDLEPSGSGSECSEDYKYEGDFFKGKKHGKGRIEWTDSTWYEGDFIMGRIEGKGKWHWTDCEYEGECKANKMHGTGVLTWNNGRKYEGIMAYGLRHGFGVLTERERKFQGYWKSGKEHGKGILEEGGNRFEGVWEEGILSKIISEERKEKTLPSEAKHKKNKVYLKDVQFPDNEKFKKIIEIWKSLPKFEYWSKSSLKRCTDDWKNLNKGVYFGECGDDGVPLGRGVWLTSASLYEGMFAGGERSGFGRYINTHNDLFIGSWISSQKSGFGVFKNDSTTYVGEWAFNKFNGIGKSCSSQSTYEGEWKDGLQHGQGTILHPDGTLYTGSFKNGAISGIGTISYPSGKKVHGVWENGRLQEAISKSSVKSSDQLTSAEKSIVNSLKLLINKHNE